MCQYSNVISTLQMIFNDFSVMYQYVTGDSQVVGEVTHTTKNSVAPSQPKALSRKYAVIPLQPNPPRPGTNTNF
jgi:hypothetical protein